MNFISAAEFENKMKDIFADSHWCKQQKEIDAIQLMCQTLDSLGYSAGTKLLKEQETMYDYEKEFVCDD